MSQRPPPRYPLLPANNDRSRHPPKPRDPTRRKQPRQAPENRRAFGDGRGLTAPRKTAGGVACGATEKQGRPVFGWGPEAPAPRSSRRRLRHPGRRCRPDPRRGRSHPSRGPAAHPPPGRRPDGPPHPVPGARGPGTETTGRRPGRRRDDCGQRPPPGSIRRARHQPTTSTRRSDPSDPHRHRRPRTAWTAPGRRWAGRASMARARHPTSPAGLRRRRPRAGAALQATQPHRPPYRQAPLPGRTRALPHNPHRAYRTRRACPAHRTHTQPHNPTTRFTTAVAPTSRPHHTQTTAGAGHSTTQRRPGQRARQPPATAARGGIRQGQRRRPTDRCRRTGWRAQPGTAERAQLVVSVWLADHPEIDAGRTHGSLVRDQVCAAA